jgi:hypothetical protein
MLTTGLGTTSRGPDFRSPAADQPSFVPPAATPAAGPAVATPARRWPMLLTAGLVVVAVSAGAGGSAGYLAGRDDRAAPPPYAAPAPAPAGVPTDLVAAAARALPGVVSVQVRTGSGGASGSGFVFDDRGHIVTNNHVVAGGGVVTIVGADGKRLDAEVVGTDPGNDIAVLRVAPSAALRPSRSPTRPRPGSASRCWPSAPRWAVRHRHRRHHQRARPPGPAGRRRPADRGADRRLDQSRQLRRSAGQRARRGVGVNTAIATLEGGGSIGIGFAVPIDRARRSPTASSAVDSRQMRLLVVEDEEDLAEGLRVGCPHRVRGGRRAGRRAGVRPADRQRVRPDAARRQPARRRRLHAVPVAAQRRVPTPGDGDLRVLMLTARGASTTGSAASTTAPTTTWSSRSTWPSCWPGSGRCCAATPRHARRS